MEATKLITKRLKRIMEIMEGMEREDKNGTMVYRQIKKQKMSGRVTTGIDRKEWQEHIRKKLREKKINMKGLKRRKCRWSASN